jgi:hypothetical protein
MIFLDFFSHSCLLFILYHRKLIDHDESAGRLLQIKERQLYLHEYCAFSFPKPVMSMSGPDLAKLGYMPRTVRRRWPVKDRKRLERFFTKLGKKQKRNTIPLNENRSLFTFISRKVMDSSYSEEEVRCMILHYFKVLKIGRKIEELVHV